MPRKERINSLYSIYFNKILGKLKIIQKKYNISTQVANRFGVGRSTLLRHIANYKAVNVGITKKAG